MRSVLEIVRVEMEFFVGKINIYFNVYLNKYINEILLLSAVFTAVKLDVKIFIFNILYIHVACICWGVWVYGTN